MLKCLLYLLALLTCFSARAQSGSSPRPRCATDIRLQQKFQKDLAFRLRFTAARLEFRKLAEARAAAGLRISGPAIYSIPVVFHIVLPDPSVVTDAQIRAQLDTLNKCFGGENYQNSLPAAFKSLAASTSFSFCLAQRSPDNLPTNGINRYKTNKPSFPSGSDDMKEPSQGGAAAWSTSKYLNIWITNIDNGILGFASFPNDGDPAHQGVVVAANTMPGVSGRFGEGKTLVHETGHFFNLYHTWGDDDGACDGSDDVNDTPNQADATYGTRSGVQTDACSPAAPGFMYQNFMDYTDDTNLGLFTAGQVARMETTLLTSRLSLTQSNGCQGVNLLPLDGALTDLPNYSKRACDPTVAPVVTLLNRGTATITAAVIRYRVGTGDWTTANFTGSLTSLTTAAVSLPATTVPTGQYSLQVELVSVNGQTDNDATNNTLNATVQYYPPITSGFTESFEGNLFPPPAWDTLNPDGNIGWEPYNGAAYTGTTSIRMRNFDYNSPGQIDWIRLPQVELNDLDSCFLSFRVAAAAYTPITTSNNVWDTLELMISRDCGKTFSSLYKKWGSTLVTVATPTTSAFVPTASQWRKDSINLSEFIGAGPLLIGFRHVNGFENNVYLDDIELREIKVLPNLKAKGMLVYPNPTRGDFRVQFYPQPNDLKALLLYDSRGALISKTEIPDGSASNTYHFNLGRQAAGVYILKALFADRVEIRRIVKQ